LKAAIDAQHADGQRIEVDWESNDELGDVVRAFNALQKSQTAAEVAQLQMAKVFQEAGDPIMIEDLDGRITEVNAEAERAYGWKRDELIGQPILTIVPEAQHDQARDLLRRCKDGGLVKNIEGFR
jgi:PAS domain-containing protein